jgi:hypothetical protein
MLQHQGSAKQIHNGINRINGINGINGIDDIDHVRDD